MTRYLIVEILLFLSPFVAYAIYLWARDLGWRAPEHWHGVPIAWLVAAGIGLVALFLAGLAFFTGEDPQGRYVPAHMENGVLVPGRIESPPR